MPVDKHEINKSEFRWAGLDFMFTSGAKGSRFSCMNNS